MVVGIMAWVLPCQARITTAAGNAADRVWTFKTPADLDGWNAAHDLGDMKVENGLLKLSITGPDAFLIAPAVQVPLDGCVVCVVMRCSSQADSQIYWSTTDRPGFTEQQVMTLATPATGSEPGPDGRPADFVRVEFRIGKPGDAGRTLTGFRIDPYNNLKSGTVEIARVEMVRVPPVFDINLSPARHWIDLNEKDEARLLIRQVGGARPEHPVRVNLGDSQVRELALSGTARASVSRVISFSEAGVHSISGVVERPGLGPFHLQSSILVGREDRLPLEPALRSDRVRLDLVHTPDRQHVAAARWQIASGPNQWRQAGWLMPLVRLAIQTPDGLTRVQPAMRMASRSDAAVELEAEVSAGAARGQARLALRLVDKAGMTAIECKASLAAQGDPVQVYDFAGPVVIVDAAGDSDDVLLQRFGLFGGLEMLEPGWRSSSDRAVGPLFAERWTPHPFKIALPVMAIEQNGLTRAMMWQPLDPWITGETMPAATFASPNFIDNQPNHLMSLAVPTIPRWREENESLARDPFELRPGPGHELVLRHILMAEGNLPIALTGRRWYEWYGAPPMPPATHDDATLYDLIARNYGDTMYWPKEKGWRNHWYHSETSSHFVPFMAAELLAHARHTGRKDWVESTGISGRSVIDTAGTLIGRIRHDAAARAAMASMRPDGTWPFSHTQAMRDLVRMISSGQYDSLGEDGTTSLGTCVQAALPILGYAEISGNAQIAAAALKALETMRQFRVPRGAQVWEVHQEIPDIRAATLAVQAYHTGYRLTGDSKWLDEAGYWAWTGAPFIYSWHVPVEQRKGSFAGSRDKDDRSRVSIPLAECFQNPERQIMPYAAVPVLGTTCYVVNWFGVIVQWCALEWASKVIALDGDRPDPLLRYIADGVVASGLQQMYDKPPWVGLYPDVWFTQENVATGAQICAMLPMRCLQAQKRIPAWADPWTRILRDFTGRKHWHVSGWGLPISVSLPTDAAAWSCKIEYLVGEPNELLVAGVEAPAAVRVDGERMDKLEAAAPVENPGWRYLADRQAVVVRFTQSKKTMTVQIGW